MVVIVSNANDPHAKAVHEELVRMGEAVVLVDLSEFPHQSKLSMSYGARQGARFTLETAEGPIDFAKCRSIWWRRPQQPKVAAEISNPAYAQFALSESHEALSGLWESLDAFWINPPTRDVVGHRKAFQLRIAPEFGLKIPETLITNDPEEAKRFFDHRGPEQIICKAFSATEAEWRETRLVQQEELARIGNVKYAPVIFQEYVEAVYDLRITVIGQDIFPAAIHSQQTEYVVDCRIDIGRAKIEAVEIPEKVRTQLLELMARLGLVYGAIDMRLRPDGTYVFLEVNPAGQWLFIEQATKQRMTESMARALARGQD